jgi:tetratricopeptide (TPR) repeat protein
MADVFISYKSERRAAARHVAEILSCYGYSVWYDYSLVKGRDFSTQIDKEIRAAKALVALWCSRSVHAEWVKEEVDLGRALGILVPVKIEPCELPVGNRLKDYVNLQSWDGSPRSYILDPLLDAVAKLVGRQPQADFRRLRDYEATWRSFGAPSLSRFALAGALEDVEPERHLAPNPAKRENESWHVPDDPYTNFDAAIDRGMALLDQKNFDGALAAFDEAFCIDSHSADSYFGSGLAYLGKRNYDQAIEAFDEVIRIDPTRARAFFERAQAYAMKTERERAIADYTEAIRLDPNYVDAFYFRSIMYVIKKDTVRAGADLKEVARINPNFKPKT